MTTYANFMKHAQKLTKSNGAKSRPILQGVLHDEHGDLIVTDSHRLYKMVGGNPSKQYKLENPTTGEIIDRNYPNASRLFPDTSNANGYFMAYIVPTLHAIKAMLTANKAINKPKYNTLALQFTGDSIQLAIEEEAALFNASHRLAANGYDSSSIHLDATYLKDAFELLKDSGSEQVKVYTFGARRPVILETQDLSILVLPVCKF